MTLFEQDFLMRQIQYLTQILQQIIFKKNQNQHQEAVEEIQNAFQTLTKDRPKEFHELDLEETLDVFMINGQFQAELATAVADLLVRRGKCSERCRSANHKKVNYKHFCCIRKRSAKNRLPFPLISETRLKT